MQVFEAKNTRIMAIGEMKIQGVSADYGNMVKLQIGGHAIFVQDLFTGPLIYARRTWA
jgi:hypothetical protein